MLNLCVLIRSFKKTQRFLKKTTTIFRIKLYQREIIVESPLNKGFLRVDEMRRRSMTAVRYIPGERARLHGHFSVSFHVIVPESEP